ncbi:polyprenyl synthetase family protein [Geminicoccus roseus]|uniref:polyprenyl synthetase family protein n=1 Tax=Geminicoccus roseus TaxID=404900 RepID=UPI0003FDCF3B|nr:farnesyl diphosphate synthase [Geminicoccus roseus]
MFKPFLEETAKIVEAEIDRLLGDPAQHAAPRLAEAMRYAALGGGKRLRAALVRAVAQTLAADPKALSWETTAASAEVLHAYSLIHDDLPAMDDASLRRGRPTCHLAFDQATAILAGDALQAAAFGWIAGDPYLSAEAKVALVAGLAQAAGLAGMCGGQMLDLEGEQTPPDLAGLERMEQLKTGAMIAFSADAGAVIAGASPELREHVAGWARCLGLAFQITDDLLDVEGDKALTGKDAGLDAARGKTTFVSLTSAEAARERLEALGEAARAHLDSLPGDVTLLHALFHHVVTRDR